METVVVVVDRVSRDVDVMFMFIAGGDLFLVLAGRGAWGSGWGLGVGKGWRGGVGGGVI